MTAVRVQSTDKTFRLDLSARGYQVLFWRDQVNRCPGCGQSNWYVGRITAECGVCGTALSITEASQGGFANNGNHAVALHVVGGPTKAARASDKREHRREPANGRTVALHIDGSPHAFALQNVSAGGLKGKALDALSMASSLVIELEDGTMLPAELKWNDGTYAGLAFVTPDERAIKKPHRSAKVIPVR